jgi:hypothetical protein
MKLNIKFITLLISFVISFATSKTNNYRKHRTQGKCHSLEHNIISDTSYSFGCVTLNEQCCNTICIGEKCEKSRYYEDGTCKCKEIGEITPFEHSGFGTKTKSQNVCHNFNNNIYKDKSYSSGCQIENRECCKSICKSEHCGFVSFDIKVGTCRCKVQNNNKNIENVKRTYKK